MNQYLIVSRAERLEEHLKLAAEYGVGLELNDFFDPKVLDSKERQQELIDCYLKKGLPKGSTMHGAFFDVTVFSSDAMIREISELRMRQSMDIAQKLGVKGVVFHANSNPQVPGAFYKTQVIEKTVAFLKELLDQYPNLDIYLENMFERQPGIIVRIAEELTEYKNFGICLDYAHASISGTPISEWVEALAPYVKHMHINDNDLQEDLHLALGTGKIDWNQFFQYVEQYFTSCSILIETTLPENQKISLEYLRTWIAER